MSNDGIHFSDEPVGESGIIHRDTVNQIMLIAERGAGYNQCRTRVLQLIAEERESWVKAAPGKLSADLALEALDDLRRRIEEEV